MALNRALARNIDALKLDTDERIKALRLAAKPADEGLREATIEECAKIADAVAEGAATPNGQSRAELIAGRIRALSPTGEPKP